MKLSRENLRLLLVDDDDMDCELLKASLFAAGFTHRFAHLRNGGIALEYFKYAKATGTEIPHVVVMDINMPLVNGVEALKRLREESAFRDVPVIMLSADDSPENRMKVTHSGIFRFVKKQPNCAKVISALDDFIGFYNSEAVSETAVVKEASR